MPACSLLLPLSHKLLLLQPLLLLLPRKKKPSQPLRKKKPKSQQLKKKKPSLLLRKKKLRSNSFLQSKMPALRGHFFGLYFAGADTALIMEPMVNFKAIFFRTLWPCALSLSLWASGPALAQDEPQLKLQRTMLSAGMYQINAQLALTPEQRQTGLMFRKEMPQSEGMLFVFEQVAQQCFWMRNTLLPLTAAFLADDGTIVNLADMKPQTTDSHCSTQPVRYVLEMNQGWFAKKGLKAGSRLSGPPFDGKR